MSEVTIEAKDGGSFFAYVARPKAEPAAVVVLVQEIFGVNQVMKDLADEYANNGFLVLVPDLIWRIAPRISLTDQSDAEWQEAFRLFNAFDRDNGLLDIQATIDFAREMPGSTGKVGCVGYCLGGYMTFLTAYASSADASVSYYGVALQNKLDAVDQIKTPLLMHVAELDQFSNPEIRDQIRAAVTVNPNVTYHFYADRDHAFARRGGAHYHEADANLANQRTVAFLKQHLG